MMGNNDSYTEDQLSHSNSTEASNCTCDAYQEVLAMVCHGPAVACTWRGLGEHVCHRIWYHCSACMRFAVTLQQPTCCIVCMRFLYHTNMPVIIQCPE